MPSGCYQQFRPLAAIHVMPLTLSVIRATRLPPGQQLSLTLDRGSVTIGRAPQSDWVLLDPERIISGQHCVVEWRPDGYYVTDTSRNGLYLNQSEERLGQGNSARLREGDQLSLGEYDIRVSITRDNASPVEPAEPPTDVFDRSTILSALARAVGESEANSAEDDAHTTPALSERLLQSLLAGASGELETTNSPEQQAAWRAGQRLTMALARVLERLSAEQLIHQFQRSSQAQTLSDAQLDDFRQWITTLYPQASREAEEIFWYELRSIFHQTSPR